ncbi:hypothetical protein ABEB36_005858 [Hypothenemus hampei]|uniref:Uncharacterized protein n=1 Tax=Hypothenemus hampei TaxID=57062 RepID=A0ABD1EZN5_HYPHA
MGILTSTGNTILYVESHRFAVITCFFFTGRGFMTFEVCFDQRETPKEGSRHKEKNSFYKAIKTVKFESSCVQFSSDRIDLSFYDYFLFFIANDKLQEYRFGWIPFLPK